MKIIIDTEKNSLIYQHLDQIQQFDLYSKEAFEILSKHWLKAGWSLKYAYQFTWLGRPIIQLPDDIIRIQEVIFALQPDVIIETGVAYGGSLLFYASLCKLLKKGRVIGVEKLLRESNREVLENHELSSLITIVEGDSVDRKIVKQVRSHIHEGESVLVILDSNHSRDHVLMELEAYSAFVTRGSYIIATDGLIKELHEAPHGKEDWKWDNPVTAVNEFATRHPEFEKVAVPPRLFNKSHLSSNLTHWPNGWLKRR